MKVLSSFLPLWQYSILSHHSDSIHFFVTTVTVLNSFSPFDSIQFFLTTVTVFNSFSPLLQYSILSHHCDSSEFYFIQTYLTLHSGFVLRWKVNPLWPGSELCLSIIIFFHHCDSTQFFLTTVTVFNSSSHVTVFNSFSPLWQYSILSHHCDSTQFFSPLWQYSILCHHCDSTQFFLTTDLIHFFLITVTVFNSFSPLTIVLKVVM